jgi:DNA-binding response OmpR family regulator
MFENQLSYPAATESTIAAQRPQVLVVESDAAIRSQLVDSFQRAGFETSDVRSGTEAIELSGARAFDMAVIDQELPDGTGIALAENLQRATQIPFLFLFTRAEIDTVVHAASIGVLGYCLKPVAPCAMGPTLRFIWAMATDRYEAIEHERRRLASELHDGLGQELTAASLMAAAIERRVSLGHPLYPDDLTPLRQSIDTAHRQCRDLSHRQYPHAVTGNNVPLHFALHAHVGNLQNRHPALLPRLGYEFNLGCGSRPA